MNPISLNNYRSLPEGLFAPGAPQATPAPKLLALNEALLQEYGIPSDWFQSDAGLAVLSGNEVNAANQPIAMAYAGHQFGHRVPRLGDGRAHMLGQMQTSSGTVDVQLKGSGRTAFSRGGDGRATLASVLREYIVSEAMAGLGIPTTRALAAIETGDIVQRERPEPGAILVRTARSHIRVGSLQFAAENLGADGVRALADHVIDEHFPAIGDSQGRYAKLLATVIESQATLIAQWMLVGFIHGVMNTDNMSIVGETIDFGPCAFMDEFNKDKVFSSIDRGGRYAWGNQPHIGLWNLTRFAETLLPLLSDDGDKAVRQAESALNEYTQVFQAAFYGGLHAKLCLPDPAEGTHDFADRTLALLGEHAVDMTVFFDALTRVAGAESEVVLLELFSDEASARPWLAEWRSVRLNEDTSTRRMRLANPVIIARNHRVEDALRAATENHDLAPFLRLVAALRQPFEAAPEYADLQTPPLPQERVTQTFCGT